MIFLIRRRYAVKPETAFPVRLEGRKTLTRNALYAPKEKRVWLDGKKQLCDE